MAGDQLTIRLSEGERQALDAVVARERERARVTGLPYETITASSVVRLWIREHAVVSGKTSKRKKG